MDLQSLRERHLVETDWLESHLDDPNIRIVALYITVFFCGTAAPVETMSIPVCTPELAEISCEIFAMEAI